MTRKRVTASEKKQRHEWAVRQIDAGMGLSELTAFTAETWGCSRRQARDVVAKAHKDWLDACYGSEEIDQRDLLSSRWDDSSASPARQKMQVSFQRQSAPLRL
jgi:hypothetical protein